MKNLLNFEEFVNESLSNNVLKDEKTFKKFFRDLSKMKVTKEIWTTFEVGDLILYGRNLSLPGIVVKIVNKNTIEVTTLDFKKDKIINREIVSYSDHGIANISKGLISNYNVIDEGKLPEPKQIVSWIQNEFHTVKSVDMYGNVTIEDGREVNFFFVKRWKISAKSDIDRKENLIKEVLKHLPSIKLGKETAQAQVEGKIISYYFYSNDFMDNNKTKDQVYNRYGNPVFGYDLEKIAKDKLPDDILQNLSIYGSAGGNVKRREPILTLEIVIK